MIRQLLSKGQPSFSLYKSHGIQGDFVSAKPVKSDTAVLTGDNERDVSPTNNAPEAPPLR